MELNQVVFLVVCVVVFVIYIIADRMWYEHTHRDGFDRKDLHPLYDVFMGYKDNDPLIFSYRHVDPYKIRLNLALKSKIFSDNIFKEEPDVFLEEVVRQPDESGILKLAAMARKEIPNNEENEEHAECEKPIKTTRKRSTK